MAAMTTVLKEFSNNGNSRTSTLTAVTTPHTAVKPRLVIEKRKTAEGNQTMLEYSVKVVYATTDSDGTVLSNKVSLEAIVRYPVLGQTTDLSEALGVFSDVIGGDEFISSVQSLNWLS